jgi:plasmid stability protein
MISSIACAEGPPWHNVVRNLEDDVKARLRVLAAEHGRSMEEEVRAILRAAVRPPLRPSGGLGTEIAALFSMNGLRDGEEIAEMPGNIIQPWNFDDC